jgi:hypothetical protein
MAKEDESIANALMLLEIAEHATAPDRRRLLRVAEGWLDLVDRIQKRRRQSCRNAPDHPLVKAKLGDEHMDAEAASIGGLGTDFSYFPAQNCRFP